jgi:FYVE/RhoGEF/PH domain-containing protein 5/6
VLEEKARILRAQIAEEMWSSERSYYDAISAIERVYGPALENAPFKFVTPQKRAAIVGNMSAVLAVSASLTLVLRERCIDQWASHSCVGDVWVAFAAQFSVYQTYIRGHRDAILALDSLDSRREFAKWMREVEEANVGVKALGNLLIMPVQRMPRYVMLISSLLERTPEWHRDFKPLKSGLTLIEEMVSGVDGAIERQENFQKTYDVARRLGMADLMSVDSRLYVRDGTLTKVCRKQDKERWFVLFSDILIYAAFDPTKLSLKNEVLRLDRTAISDCKEPDNAFSIRSEQKSFIVYGTSEMEKKEWMDILQARIDECGGGVNTTAQTAPVWTPDKHSSNCLRCFVEFTLINRRHHCRKCGDLVCSRCSQHKMLVPNIDAKKALRVCDVCLMK